ncbi:DNA photolyase family protein [Candidatus Gracilibacteria bacterium]|nr:DNA photolyase family protein [Candidatus Gracilibacteria bacterium]
MYKKSLFIFRQDLRLDDNTGLLEAMKNSHEIFPIFIHDERSISDFGIDDPRFGFIREALESIDQKLQEYDGRITLYGGKPEIIIDELIKRYSIEAIFCNRSYSPKGKERDDSMLVICENHGIDFHSFQDFLLVEPHECEQRKVFTPYSMLWKKFLIANPERLIIQNFDGSTVSWFVPENRKEISEIIRVPHHPYFSIPFGAERMNRDFSNYYDLRNIPGVDGSTRLSPYIRFGVFSIREIYKKVQDNPTLLSEIIWREFWYQIAYYFPFTYTLEFQERRRSIVWDTDTDSYLWKQFEAGKTGYPLVDAAIKQLYETNWMHNRLRMVVASFLTKNLGIDWRIGEKWFKKYLIDYDEAVNYGNWQWSASVGADPKPVRIFNPLLQSEKFDGDAKFIKKYIPELEDIDPKKIHSLELQGVYYNPIVNQKESAANARARYRGEL